MLSHTCLISICVHYLSTSVPTKSNVETLQKKRFCTDFEFVQIFCKERGWDDVIRVVPPVGGGGWACMAWCKQRSGGLARHPATHLLIFSDEDFYLRLILYSFQPACIVSLQQHQPPSLPQQAGWRQQHFAKYPQTLPGQFVQTTLVSEILTLTKIDNCTLKCMCIPAPRLLPRRKAE